MTQTSHTDYEDLMRRWRDMAVDNWSTMAQQTASHPAFVHWMGAWTDLGLQAQEKLREQSGAFMDTLEMPRRSDIARLATQTLAIERRLADLEDKLDADDKLDKVLALLNRLDATVQRLAARESHRSSKKPS